MLQNELLAEGERLILELQEAFGKDVVVEPSAAVPLAAVLSDRFRQLDGMARVGVILSGGNVDLDRFFAAFE